MNVDLEGISWVQLSFVDVFGVGHSMQIPVERFDSALERGEPFDGSALEGRARLLETDMLLRPDPATLVRTGEGVARAACTVLTHDGLAWPGDPRTALGDILARFGDLGKSYMASAELEFYLLEDGGRPIDHGGYFDEYEGAGMAAVRAAGDRLRSLGVAVEGAHHEAGPGQFEIDLSSMAPLVLADAIVLAKHTVRETAGEQGLKATFMARPFGGEAGSGLHVHQRASGGFFNGDGSLDASGRSFVAGQLTHARSLSALVAPTVNSYKRLHSGPEAPSAVVWAHVNRAALIRVSSYMGRDASIEFRGGDPSANPYLLIGGLLVAGAHGMESELELQAPVEEEIGGFDPAGDSFRFEPLPRDLEDAVEALMSDDVLVDAFDRALLSRLVDGRRAEAAEYRTQVTEWELARYLEES